MRGASGLIPLTPATAASTVVEHDAARPMRMPGLAPSAPAAGSPHRRHAERLRHLGLRDQQLDAGAGRPARGLGQLGQLLGQR